MSDAATDTMQGLEVPAVERAAREEKALRLLLDPATIELAKRVGAMMAARAAVEIMRRRLDGWSAETAVAMREAAALSVLKSVTLALQSPDSPIVTALLAVADVFHADERALGQVTRDSIVGHRDQVATALRKLRERTQSEAGELLAEEILP